MTLSLIEPASEPQTECNHTPSVVKGGPEEALIERHIYDMISGISGQSKVEFMQSILEFAGGELPSEVPVKVGSMFAGSDIGVKCLEFVGNALGVKFDCAIGELSKA